METHFSVPKTLKSIENRLCVDCAMPLSLSNVYGSSVGIWICPDCAKIHKDVVKSHWCKHVSEEDWLDEEVDLCCLESEKHGGNIGFNMIYERYIPIDWQKINPDSELKDKTSWILAKYVYNMFVIPNGRMASSGAGAHKGPATASNGAVLLPSRIVDFFLVIGGKYNNTNKPEFKKLNSKTDEKPSTEPIFDIQLQPVIHVTYPNKDSYVDMTIPELIGTFVFPYGIRFVTEEIEPTFFTFVLTDTSGCKLFGAALCVHELVDSNDLNEMNVPQSMFPSATKGSRRGSMFAASVLYVPKALVLISHYPFFHLFREYVLTLYRISSSTSNIPIERYLVNFISETPLPPQGLVEINNCTLPDKVLQISRPRKNQLPMVDFSYRPLFMCLSVDNIITVFSALCAEYPVCIVSENISVLTPICEALLSLLFPLVWQGVYIPILPGHMNEILDAPVPYLVGMRRKYFDTTVAPSVPHSGTIFVDVDNDIVYLPKEDNFDFGNSDGSHKLVNIRIPNAKMLAKLKTKLVEFGGIIYHGPGFRELIANGSLAYPAKEYIVPMEITDSQSGISVMRKDTSNKSIIGGGQSGKKHLGAVESSECCTVVISGQVQKKSAANSSPKYNAAVFNPLFNNPVTGEVNTAECIQDSFNAHEIRSAFLRLFVALFLDYEDYILLPNGITLHPEKSSRTLSVERKNASAILFPTFVSEKFLAHCGNDPLLEKILSTQMFDKFIHEKILSIPLKPNDTPTVPVDIRFFDESILAKSNRSMMKLIKSSTPFMANMSDAVAETFATPTPNTWGIPLNVPFKYSKFPVKFNKSFLEPIRPPRTFLKEPETARARDQSANITSMIGNTNLFLKMLNNEISDSTGDEDDEGNMRESMINIRSTMMFPGEKAAVLFLMEAKRNYERVVYFITRVQSLYRMHVKRKQFLQRFGELKKLLRKEKLRVLMLSFFKLALIRTKYLIAKRSVRLIQCSYRMVLVKRRFAKKKRCIIKIQSSYRRYFVSSKARKDREKLIGEVRAALPALWHISATSLIYRSRFWVYMKILSEYSAPSESIGLRIRSFGFISLAIYRQEFFRLCYLIGLDDSSWKAISRTAGKASTKSRISHANFIAKLRQVTNLVESNSLNTKQATIAQCRLNLEKERVEMYKTMKSYLDDSSIKTDIFSEFGLSTSKKRKQTLCNSVWTTLSKGSCNHYDMSASVTLEIFHTQEHFHYLECGRPDLSEVLKEMSLDKSELKSNSFFSLGGLGLFQKVSAAASDVDGCFSSLSPIMVKLLRRIQDNLNSNGNTSKVQYLTSISYGDMIFLDGVMCKNIYVRCAEAADILASSIIKFDMDIRKMRLRQAAMKRESTATKPSKRRSSAHFTAKPTMFHTPSFLMTPMKSNLKSGSV